MHVSFDIAQQIIDKAVEKSKEIGVKMCIAVLDSGGNLKSFIRMDDAWVFPVQFHLNDQFMLAYSYDWGFSDLSRYHMGSHEVFVRYCFLFKKNVTSVRSF